MKKETKVLLADGIQSVDYKVVNRPDGQVEVYYYEADGFRRSAVGDKMVFKTADGKPRKETRKQLIKRLCDTLGIAY